MHTKSKHTPLENLSANLPTKFEAFSAITQEPVLFLVKIVCAQHYRYNNHTNS